MSTRAYDPTSTRYRCHSRQPERRTNALKYRRFHTRRLRCVRTVANADFARFVREGAMFRRVIGCGTVTTDENAWDRIGERLNVDAIAQAFKRVAKWIKMPAEEVAQVSGLHRCNPRPWDPSGNANITRLRRLVDEIRGRLR
jgi:hypothetical protein